MRNKGTTITHLDDAQNTAKLCINGLKNRTMTPKELLNSLQKIDEKISKAMVLINTNNETP